jgi:uncharacterized membrane protein
MSIALAAVWIHVVSAMTWIGGMIFLSLVFVPVLKQNSFGAERRLLFRTVARRFRIVVWVAIGLLAGSGAFLLPGRVDSVREVWSWPLVLIVKLILVVLLLVLTGLHDFWLGPRVSRLSPNSGHQQDQQVIALARLSPLIARVGLVLALAVLFAAIVLVRT